MNNWYEFRAEWIEDAVRNASTKVVDEDAWYDCWDYPHHRWIRMGGSR